MYVELGYTCIQSYIQSGNVIFKSDIPDSSLLERTIHN